MVTFDDICKEVVKQLNMKDSTIDECCRIQFEYLFNRIKEGDKDVKLPFLGKFARKPITKKYRFPGVDFLLKKYPDSEKLKALKAKELKDNEDSIRANDQYIWSSQ